MTKRVESLLTTVRHKNFSREAQESIFEGVEVVVESMEHVTPLIGGSDGRSGGTGGRFKTVGASGTDKKE